MPVKEIKRNTFSETPVLCSKRQSFYVLKIVCDNE